MRLTTAMETGSTRTLNDCATNSSTSNTLVDLFFQLNVMRGRSDTDIISLFNRAFAQDQLAAMRILFYSRDIRGGQGERNTFRIILQNLATGSHANWVQKNIQLIPHFGRWDDLLVLFGTPLESAALNCISTALNAGDALCAKWMPREKSSKGYIACKIRNRMGITPRQYRKLLTTLTSVVETQMCAQEWSDISYSSVPSIAMKNYRRAFERHTPQRWTSYIEDLKSGKTTVNAGTLYPHDLVRPFLSESSYGRLSSMSVNEQSLLNEQWNTLPNYLEGNSERILPVVDTSGSMYGGYYCSGSLRPIEVSVALGLYIAERNKGVFHDHFITFSQSPTLQKVAGSTLRDRVQSVKTADWGYNTDLQKVFELILNSALRHSVTEDDMPTMVIIFSDMEFDQACSVNDTAMQSIRQKYQLAGYTLPKVVFWNLNAKTDNFPVKCNEAGTALVSGFSPSIMKQLLSGKDFSPEAIMHSVIDSERYACVS